MLNIVFISTGPFIRQLEIDLFIGAISKKYKTHKLSLKNITKREHTLLDEIEYTNIKSYNELKTHTKNIINTKISKINLQNYFKYLFIQANNHIKKYG